MIGVLQAINKRGLRGEKDHVPFQDIDVSVLSLLVALTSQQLRLCELVGEKENANAKTRPCCILSKRFVHSES